MVLGMGGPEVERGRLTGHPRGAWPMTTSIYEIDATALRRLEAALRALAEDPRAVVNHRFIVRRGAHGQCDRDACEPHRDHLRHRRPGWRHRRGSGRRRRDRAPALDLPDQLRFVRTTMLDVIEEFDVIRAGLKLVEHTAHGRHEFRLNLEGVLQEMLASSPVERYFAGRIDRLTFLLGEQSRPLVKQYIRGQQPFDRVPTWDQYRRVEVRESVLAAIAALQL